MATINRSPSSHRYEVPGGNEETEADKDPKLDAEKSWVEGRRTLEVSNPTAAEEPEKY